MGIRTVFIIAASLFVIAALAACREDWSDGGPVTVLFTGDDHGLITPVG